MRIAEGGFVPWRPGELPAGTNGLRGHGLGSYAARVLTHAARAADELRAAVASGARHIGLGRQNPLAAVDAAQPIAYELAFAAAEEAALRTVLTAADDGRMAAPVAARAAALLLRAAWQRFAGRRASLGLGSDTPGGSAFRQAVAAGLSQTTTERVLAAPPAAALPQELTLLAAEFRRFAAARIAPLAQAIHREDRDLPEDVIAGLAAMGAFGLSIPPEHGGSFDPGLGHLPMVVATEELSRASLAAGGSLITRPEILARAVLDGGTAEQRARWLPGIASGELMVAVAVTEPDAGSDVAALRTRAEAAEGGGWRISGSKTWCTFAGRAELLMVLARTDPDPAAGHRGLSLFVVEKPPFPGREFAVKAGDGRLAGRAVPTVGYRGMHSFELTFDRWPMDAGALLGGADGEGRGFHLQMGAFAAGRLQTSARAAGLMQAAADAATAYAGERRAFGKRLADHGLTRHRLADMRARTEACRLFAYDAAADVTSPAGQLAASMVKALACRAAEEVSRDAMQLHGGYGYAEEYDVSRYWVDARVLSIFEGAEEVLALRVIARRLVEQAMEG